MGMCNLTWPGADKMLANASIRYNVPTCVSMASTTSLEKMYEISKDTHGFSYIFFKMKIL